MHKLQLFTMTFHEATRTRKNQSFWPSIEHLRHSMALIKGKRTQSGADGKPWLQVVEAGPTLIQCNECDWLPPWVDYVNNLSAKWFRLGNASQEKLRLNKFSMYSGGNSAQ